MQVRWNYKLQPNKAQQALMGEWLVTLRKHRNYCLRERKRGFESNNQDSEQAVMYGYGSFCDTETRDEYGSFCPLSCPVVKHGVLSSGLLKTTKPREGKKTKEIIPAKLSWGNASDVQSKRTTELRHENPYFARIYSGVLQGNLAKLDAAYAGFLSMNADFQRSGKLPISKLFNTNQG